MFLLVASGTLSAQGLLFDSLEYEKIQRQSSYNDGMKSAFKVLENVEEWSLRPYCPEVQDQGEISSCVGWAVGYGAMSIQQAVLNGWKGQKDLITSEAFSALYIFNQINKGCEKGASIEDALKLLHEKGDVLSKTFDDDKSNCERKPIESEVAWAQKNKIMDYMTLFDKNDNERIKINKTKLSLVSNKPVIFGMRIPKSFKKARAESDSWYAMPDEKGLYGHAMIVVGFDEERKAFEVMNSWGKDWRTDGFVWIKYDDFANYVSFAYQMSLKEKIKKDKKYSAKFDIQELVAIKADGQPICKDIPVVLKNNYYELKNKFVEQGDYYRVLVSQVTDGMYLYALNIDPLDTVKVVFPNEGESPRLSTEVRVLVPDTTSVLQFNLKGTEYFIMIFSIEPISNIAEKFKGFNFKEEDPLHVVYQVFGNKVIPFESLNYRKNAMLYNNELPEGSIIPILLKVEVE